MPLLIEIKSDARRTGPLEAAAWRLLADYVGAAGVLSFSPWSLAWYRRHAPALPRGLNLSARRGRLPRRGAPLHRFLARPHFLSHEVDGLTAGVAMMARARGLPLLAWTVRTRDERERAALHADNYIFEGFRP